jgi:prepilin-type N-terminal cleavage/methylation domain-containing protein
MKKGGFTLIEIVVVMALMATTAIMVITPALFARRGQLETERMASEIIMDVRYAQSLARGVVWEGDVATLRPKIIYVEIFNNGSNGISIRTFGNHDGGASVRARRFIERPGFTISRIVVGSTPVPANNKLVIGFSVPRGESSSIVILGSQNPTFNCPPFGDEFSTSSCLLSGRIQDEDIVLTVRDARGNERDITVDWLTGKINA